MGGEPIAGEDRIATVIEALLNRAQEAAQGLEWDTVRDLARRVLKSGAASQDAERQARQFLQLAELDSESPRGAGFAPQTFSNVVVAGERTPVDTPGRTFELRSNLATLKVPTRLLRLFYSYVDADAAYRKMLRTSIAGFRQSSSFDLAEWDREMIRAGEDPAEVTERELNRADIILLLISQDYINEASADDAEIQRALLRQANDGARVVPIMVRPAFLPEGNRLKALRPLPADGRTVKEWESDPGGVDLAFAKIAEGIKQVCDDLARDMTTARLSLTASPRKTYPASSDVRT